MSNRRTVVKIVNDDAAVLDVRGGLGFFASRLAPTGDLRWMPDLRSPAAKTVGASLLAMVANDDAAVLDVRGGLWFFASKLAPTNESSPRCHLQAMS